MIERLRDFPYNVVAFACEGRVTWQDYHKQLATAREWIVPVNAT